MIKNKSRQFSQTEQKKIGRVAVLMGGDSAERKVSLKSGHAALEALKRKGFDAFALDLRFHHANESTMHENMQENDYESVCQQLNAQEFDTAFIALHGRGGEDGVIQGVLEALAIPYTGCHVAASAIAMDKLRTKWLWKGCGLPTPPFELLKAAQICTEDKKIQEQLLEQLSRSLGFPLMIKPAHEGSSIGMSKVNNKASLLAALKTAAYYDDELLIEAWVSGKEYTGAVLNGQALPLIRLETPREFYDYQAKYETDDTLYHCPCGLDKTLEKDYQSLVLEAFDAIGAYGWGRIDFMCDEQGRPWLIEINTVPGLTDHSLVPMAAGHAHIEFDDLIVQILRTAVN